MTAHPRALILCPIIVLFISSCNPGQGENRDEQLEQTAENLEAKASQVRQEIEKSVDVKIAEAKELRETKGDKKTAKLLEKDASVTREVGELRAGQLEKQAEKVREQAKEQAKKIKEVEEPDE